MKRSLFLLIAAVGSFGFGALMFFAPGIAANLLGIELSPGTSSLLHGMGGLIIGTGTMNFLFRNSVESTTVRALLLTNVITHFFGLSADIWGIADGALTLTKMAPVELTPFYRPRLFDLSGACQQMMNVILNVIFEMQRVRLYLNYPKINIPLRKHKNPMHTGV